MIIKLTLIISFLYAQHSLANADLPLVYNNNSINNTKLIDQLGNVIIILNPKDCLSCISSLRTNILAKTDQAFSIVVPSIPRTDGDILVMKAFGFKPKAKIYYSDSLYSKYSPDNISCLIFQKNNKVYKRISLSVLGEKWAINNTESPYLIKYKTSFVSIKGKWSTKTQIGIGKQDLFIADYSNNLFYSLNLSKIFNDNSNTIVNPSYTWSPSSLSYKDWYIKYFQDTSGLAKSVKLSYALSTIGRQDAQLIDLTCSPTRPYPTLTIQWAHTAPDGPKGEGIGVRLRTLFTEVNNGVALSFYAKNKERADSAGYSISSSRIFWNTDSTFIGALKPNETLLAKHVVRPKPVVAEFVLRNGNFFWKHSLNTVNWPTPQLRDQKLIGDYGVLIPDFFYTDPYIFFQAANEIYDTENGIKYSLRSYSDKDNDFNIRKNNKLTKLDYEVKATGFTEQGHIVCVIRQGIDYHAIVMDEYLSLLSDCILESRDNNSKNWAVYSSGYIVSFDPTDSTIKHSRIY